LSISYNPRIVTDNLVLALDAGNPKSYPGSGTTWYDLSGNGNNVTISGATYNSSEKLGCFDFDGTDDYAYSSSTVNNMSGLSGLSIFMWCKADSGSPSRRYAYDGRGNKILAESQGGPGLGFDAGYSDDKIFNFITAADNSYTEANSPTTFLRNQIYQLGLVREPNSNTHKVLDTDSKTLITPSYTTPRMTANASMKLGPFVIGTFSSSSPGSNYWWNGQIYCVLAYNRALTQNEVSQNFNALRGRFGI
jgi:hypothetical protein